MKLKLGPQVRRALGMTDGEVEALIDTSNESEVMVIRKRVMQALAATGINDLGTRNRITIKDTAKQQYRLGLKLTWEWPVPLALDLTILDETTWEIELVKDDTKPD